ncbi:hypothetical protein CROQUDRAFT_428144 [Cronartium quercuum f. sp. fusiforme G11]|uniref:Uncharacterized protein n=1 Tax=Cronartium quercuum f. sp. fusiforme G11 TaxID=708437 RepID=A0A9P6NR61_9BASI|nr:hypothetical protein CROQUDRAFT_428144 [Cronartium quercuum f. sp. fusiforme G11]
MSCFHLVCYQDPKITTTHTCPLVLFNFISCTLLTGSSRRHKYNVPRRSLFLRTRSLNLYNRKFFFFFLFFIPLIDHR